VAISTTMIKELREATGAGVLDCKKALEATNGDVDKAVTLLRDKGLAAAAKKSSREANEGRVSVLVNKGAHVGAIVEVNCETDFVARTEEFQSFVDDLTRQVGQQSGPAGVEELLQQPFAADGERTIGEGITELVAKLGENIVLRRFDRIERNGPGLIEGYVHPGSRIGVLVQVSVDSEGVAQSPALFDVVHDLALQIAAAAPQFIAVNDIPKATIDAQRAEYEAQLVGENKPDHIKERIVSGKLDKWYEEVCLLSQLFVKESSLTVEKLLAQKSEELGDALSVEGFIRYEIGLGE
jgi:elongation factor Ts